MKKTKTVYILMAVFILLGLRDFRAFSLLDSSIDYAIMREFGLGALYTVFLYAAFALDAATIGLLFRPRPIGFRIATSAIVIGVISSVSTTVVELGNIEIVKSKLMERMLAAGTPVTPELFDSMVSPTSIVLACASLVLFYMAIFVLLYRIRGYFRAVPQS
jgi:hypothetical protein